MTFSQEDRDQLVSLLWSFSDYASDGNALIGLGEVIQYLEYLDEDSGDEIDILVTLSLGHRVSHCGYEEGIFADMTLGFEGLVFEVLNTTYSPGEGSDHFTEGHARFDSMASFDYTQIQSWISIVNIIMSSGRAALQAERLHA